MIGARRPALLHAVTEAGTETEPTKRGPGREARLPVRAADRARGRAGDGLFLAMVSLVALASVMLFLVVHLVLIGRLEHRAAQATAYEVLRNQLAKGVAPVAQVDPTRHLLATGRPIALLEIPRLHIQEVVFEGTTGEVLTRGPGHLRSTVLPGQAGTSVIYGRAAAYGGPFGGLHRLRKGDLVQVVSGVGKTVSYAVIDSRKAGDPLPAQPAAGSGRVTLVTAEGAPFVPNGTLQVDADATQQVSPASPVATATVPGSERAMGRDTSHLWQLLLLLEALLLVAVASVVAWRLWGRAQAWIVFVPVTLLLADLVAGQVARLLPNLL